MDLNHHDIPQYDISIIPRNTFGVPSIPPMQDENPTDYYVLQITQDKPPDPEITFHRVSKNRFNTRHPVYKERKHKK